MTPRLLDERGFDSLEVETDGDREVAASVNAESNSDPTVEDDAFGERHDSGREGKEYNSDAKSIHPQSLGSFLRSLARISSLELSVLTRLS